MSVLETPGRGIGLSSTHLFPPRVLRKLEVLNLGGTNIGQESEESSLSQCHCEDQKENMMKK